MMKNLFIVVAAVVFLAMCGLIWVNRGSEKIVTGAVMAIIPFALAIIMGVLVFGGEPSIVETFSTNFFYDHERKLPLASGWLAHHRSDVSPFLPFAPGALLKIRPELFASAEDPTGQTLYHHLLQRGILDWMTTRYRGSWETELVPFDIGNTRGERFGPAPGSLPSHILSTADLKRLFSGNWFEEIDWPIPPQLAVPPGTTMTVTPPSRKEGAMEYGDITLRTRFVTLSIRTEAAMWIRSVGSYQQLAATQAEAERLGTAVYVVRIRAEFTRWRSGHPDMPRYKAWVRQIGDQLKARLDERAIWQQVKEDYLLQAGALGARR
jgi:hypothetical protein